MSYTWLIISFLFILKAILTLFFAVRHVFIQRARRKEFEKLQKQEWPGVSVLVAAFNEEIGVEHTLRSVLATNYPKLQVIVVDDGSTDRTSEIVEAFAATHPQVHLVRQANAGKAAALNHALRHARHEVSVTIDADSIIDEGALHALARHFLDERVGAVAGDVRVGGCGGFLTWMQRVEYTFGQHFEKRAQDVIGAITVIPGAAGAFRTDVLRSLDGYSRDTITEDMDLTIEISRRGHLVRFEPDALSFTEAPCTWRDLWKQRVRWMYGTFQVLAKHRHVLFRSRHGGLGLFGLPMVLFGVVLGLLAPVLEGAWLLLALLSTDVLDLAGALLGVLGVEAATIGTAVVLGRERTRAIAFYPLQRPLLKVFLMVVVAVTITRFVRRERVAWNKLQRRGLRSPEDMRPAVETTS